MADRSLQALSPTPQYNSDSASVSDAVAQLHVLHSRLQALQRIRRGSPSPAPAGNGRGDADSHQGASVSFASFLTTRQMQTQPNLC